MPKPEVVSKPEPQADPKPVAPTRPRPAGNHPSLTGAFSIKTTAATASVPPSIAIEVKPLTEESLNLYWNEAAKNLGLEELLSEGIPRIGEQIGQIEVDAQTVSFSDEFKPHKIEVMEFLRAKTGMKMLDCKVNPRFLEKTEVVYSPDDKYNAMLAVNPGLSELRKLFPNLDY